MEVHKDIGYDIITELVPRNSRVLDLGCGGGELLALLRLKKNIDAFGVEISEEGVSLCLEKGLYCYQADMDDGLVDYKANSFDFVILNQTIQSTKKPDFVLKEMMRISRKAIISFPNFAHISVRHQMACRGVMPKSEAIPYEWYDTPNIHMVTINDFEIFCRAKGYPVETRFHFNMGKNKVSRRARIMPNLFAQYGLFVLNGTRLIR